LKAECNGPFKGIILVSIMAAENDNILLKTAGLPIEILTANFPSCHRRSAHYTVNNSLRNLGW
jgi:hypothetical protein